jgi:hypothetical protein
MFGGTLSLFLFILSFYCITWLLMAIYDDAGGWWLVLELTCVEPVVFLTLYLWFLQSADSKVNANIFASTGVPFTLTTVQVSNIALTHTKRITVLGIVRQTDWQITERKTGSHKGGQTGKKAIRWQKYRQITDRLTNKKASGQADRQAGRQATSYGQLCLPLTDRQKTVRQKNRRTCRQECAR